MELAAGQEFAGYSIVRRLGAGGMGEVYLADHPRLPRRDALKVMPAHLCADAAFRRRFGREAELAASMDHPNIVDVYDRGEFDGRLWISMRYVDGDDAATLLNAHPGGLAAVEAARIVAAVADALDYAHGRNLLHRDVKPANVLLAGLLSAGSDATGERPRIMLADFGIARPILDDAKLTATNLTVGSFAYSSPEQLNGDTLDGRADQYSLACTAYQLLSGTTPFVNSSAALMIHQQLSQPAPAISERRRDLGSSADAVLARALSKDPAARYPSCTAFAGALADAVADAPAPAAPRSRANLIKPAAVPPGQASAPSYAPTPDPAARTPSPYSPLAPYPAAAAHSPAPATHGYAPHLGPPEFSPAGFPRSGYPAPQQSARPDSPLPNASMTPERARKLGLWSLLTAIAAVPASCAFGVGGILAAGFAIYLGVRNLRQASHLPTGPADPSTGRTLAIVGLSLGTLALLWSCLMLAAFISTA